MQEEPETERGTEWWECELEDVLEGGAGKPSPPPPPPHNLPAEGRVSGEAGEELVSS